MAWAVLVALFTNLLWPTTMVVASAADPATALLFSPICKAGDTATTDGSPTQTPAHAAHCPLCLISGNHLIGPLTPVTFLRPSTSVGAAYVAIKRQDRQAGILSARPKARAPPRPA